MATPTGYEFLDGGIYKDFADVFEITYPSGVSTGYISNKYPYNGKDLGQIFKNGTSAKTTSYYNPLHIDLGSIFDLKNMGPWYALGDGISGGSGPQVNSIAIDSSGNVYVGGFFTTAGTISASNIAMWIPSSPGIPGTWYALGAGISGGSFPLVNSIAIDSSGNVYVGGKFTTAGTIPASNIAVWIPGSPGTGTWSALGTGVSGSGSQVNHIAIDSSGNVYVGGKFTAPASNIAVWMPSSPGTWYALGTGVTGGTLPEVNHIAINSSGNVYVGGTFDTAGGIIVNNIAIWTPTTILVPYTGNWSTLSSGLYIGISGAFVYAIAIDNSSGNVYVGGSFSTAGGITVNNIAIWMSSSLGIGAWSALGSGLINGDNIVYSIAIDSYGNVYAGGSFLISGTISVQRIAMWTPSLGTWSALGTGVGGGSGPEVYTISIDVKNVYTGGFFTTAGTISASNIAKYVVV